MPRILISLSAAALLCLAGVASAEVLLVDRVQQENKAAMPRRGMSMAQDEARLGAPAERHDARGGHRRRWPTHHRRVYQGFVAHFDSRRILDTASAEARRCGEECVKG